VLKKVFIGLFCFIILAITGAGIYLYTLDWNQHKALVSERFSRITGLKALIDGDLRVELFPSPRFTASRVKFFPKNGSHTPLVEVNEMTAEIDPSGLLDNHFKIVSMTLKQATANVIVESNDTLNWAGVGTNSNTKYGNFEISFNDIRVENSTLNYQNINTKEDFDINGISARIQAPSLKGPYTTDGKFIHNNSEVRLKGTIIKDNDLKVNLDVINDETGSRITWDGTTGSSAKGLFSFETQSLVKISDIIFGQNTLSKQYDFPLYYSFQYNIDDKTVDLEDVTLKYGKNTMGKGSLKLTNTENKKRIFSAVFDMSSFNFDTVENLVNDLIKFNKSGRKLDDTKFGSYEGNISLNSKTSWYNDIENGSVSMNIAYRNGIIDIKRFNIKTLGDTTFATIGRLDTTENMQYVFNPNFETQDLKTFASIFNIDLTQYTPAENKKSVFNHAKADFIIAGNLDNFEISLKKASIDNTDVKGTVSTSLSEENTAVKTELNISKIVFDKYLNVIPEDMENSSLKDKFIYQLKHLTLAKNTIIDANVFIDSALYNNVPLQNAHLDFLRTENTLDVRQFEVKDIAGAYLSLSLKATDILDDPNFSTLTYDVKTGNLTQFADAIGVKIRKEPLFKRKLFAAQGVLNGTFDNFNLSSIQKFGDTEFSYTGTVNKSTDGDFLVDGDLELKTQNFSQFIKALDFNYHPDIPVTLFTLSGKLTGISNIFELTNFQALLGVNSIQGNFQFDGSGKKPQLKGTFAFDKLEVNRWFDFKKENLFTSVPKTEFIAKPQFSTNKIDYSTLDKINFDFDITTKSFTFNGKTYSDGKTSLKLNNGLLVVDNFSAISDKSSISLAFSLNSALDAQIEGTYNLTNWSLPKIGGTLYALDDGEITAKGNFSSSAVSFADFIYKLNSKGDFNLNNTSITGWDLDIIKFELEQRKTVEGFEETILRSLKSGKSSFSSISGNYIITNGNIQANNILWQSPVADIDMDLQFNLNDWLLNTNFDTVYHNASFSDVVKFSLTGNASAPNLSVDIEESLKRIGTAENKLKQEKLDEIKKQEEMISTRKTTLQNNVEQALLDISRLSLEILRFVPTSGNSETKRVYDTNLDIIKNGESTLKSIKEKLAYTTSEKELILLQSEFGNIQSDLQFITKTLEDNFVLDSKYAYDALFNKIAWVYDVANNNFSYFDTKQIDFQIKIEEMKTSENSISSEDNDRLKELSEKISHDMDKIKKLHTKIRDNYLFIVDTATAKEMKDNNDVAEQALQTMLTYTKQMNEDIINGIEAYRAILKIQERDYDNYLIYPPESISDIDISKPTTPANIEISEVIKETLEEDTKETAIKNKDKKKDSDTLKNALGDINTRLFETASIFNNFIRTSTDTQNASSISFNGLENLLASNITETKNVLEITPQVTALPATSKTTVSDKRQKILLSNIPDTHSGKNRILPKKLSPVSNINSPSKVTEIKPLSKVAHKDDSSIKSENINISLLEKSKNIFSNVLDKLKTAQQNIKDTFSPLNKANLDTEAALKQLSDSEIRENNVQVLKNNPVIALELGKEAPIIKKQKNNTNTQRVPFSIKKNIIQDITKSEDVAFNISAIKPYKNITILSVEHSSSSVQTPRELSSLKEKSISESLKNINQNGTVKKVFLKNKPFIIPKPVNQQYLFVQNGGTYPRFTGRIEKHTTLNIQ
jgi:hypothetical protein